jgi:PAS domain S-box-containing protein
MASGEPADDPTQEACRRIAALERRVEEQARELERMRENERALLAQQQVLQTVLDESPDVIVVKDHEGKFLLANRTVATLYGTTPEAMVGKDDGDFSASPEQAEFFRQNVLGIMARGETEVVYEESTDDKTGQVRFFKSIKKPFKATNGLSRVLVMAHDITDVTRAQQRVVESEQRLRYVLAATGEGIWDWDVPTGKLKHNQRWYDVLGYREEDFTGTIADFERVLLPEERDGVMAAVKACFEGQGPYYNEHSMRCADGRIIRVIDRGDVFERAPDGSPLRMVGSFADMTREMHARDEVTRSLREKETLIKEIHHRVKNNLQIISSLLALQADNVAEASSRALLHESVARVRSMALIHQKLYIADDLANIDFGDYALSLTQELVSVLAPEARVEVDADPVELNVEMAVPFGLALNELATNALKHGRAADGSCVVMVALRRLPDGFSLSVSDRGPGLPPNLDIKRTTSLGLQLVRSLARQVRAELLVESRDGTQITLRLRT